MGVFDAVKQTIGKLTGEDDRRQREQQEAEQKRLTAETKRLADEKRATDEAQKNKPTLDRQQAERDRRVELGPAERVLATVEAVPQPEPVQHPPQPTKVAEQMKLTPGMQNAPSPGGSYKNPRAYRPAQVPVQELPTPNPVVSQTGPQVEDLADLVKRRIVERREADQQRRNALTPEQQQTESTLKQLEQAKRGTVVRSYETGLSMTRTREDN